TNVPSGAATDDVTGLSGRCKETEQPPTGAPASSMQRPHRRPGPPSPSASRTADGAAGVVPATGAAGSVIGRDAPPPGGDEAGGFGAGGVEAGAPGSVVVALGLVASAAAA